MKHLITLLALMIVSSSLGQDFSKKYENAAFEVKHNGNMAYSTDVRSEEGVFTNYDYNNITLALWEKEGIFGVEWLEDTATIRVFHLSQIDLSTIKHLFLSAKGEFDLSLDESVDFEIF